MSLGSRGRPPYTDAMHLVSDLMAGDLLTVEPGSRVADAA